MYKNAPAGLLFPGDPGIPNNSHIGPSHWVRFAPRLGLAWDPQGDGRMTVRAAYGIFTDYPHFYQYGGYSDQPPWGYEVTLDSGTVGSFEDPWQNYPGGNPFPISLSANIPFPLSGTYVTIPRDLEMPYTNQWNLSVQRQIGADWLLTANYLGSSVIHNLINSEGNPAIYGPGASTANLRQRRKLYLQNQTQGQYFGNIVIARDDGTRTYNAMLVSIQRRRSNGMTVQANYTLSHCIEDWGTTPQFQNNGQQTPERRRLNRGNCDQDRRHNFNASTVYETPQFSNTTLRLLGTGWKISGIVRVLSGNFLSILPGTDRALTGTGDQLVDRVLADPYGPGKTIDLYLNPAAFAQPVSGTYGNMGRNSILGPGSFRVDLGVTRAFKVRERQSFEFRAEAFNAMNHVNPGLAAANLTLNNANFGKMQNLQTGLAPRVIQLALKFVF